MFGRSKERNAEGPRRRSAPEGSAYLRSNRPVRVRPGLRGQARRALRWSLMALCIGALGVSVAYAIEGYLRTDTRFVLTGDAVRVTGLRFLDAAKVQQVFDPDLGGSIAEIPLAERQQSLTQLSWVARASVLRIWPSRVWVHVEERRPVAFVRLPRGRGSRMETARLIDGEGVFLDTPAGARLALPVITGVAPEMAATERRQRLALFETLIQTLDGGDPPYSPLLSEIDISDLHNVRVSTMHGGDVIDLQMGDDQFRHRYALFLKYIDSWKKEFGEVRAVDLRFEGQVAVR